MSEIKTIQGKVLASTFKGENKWVIRIGDIFIWGFGKKPEVGQKIEMKYVEKPKNGMVWYNAKEWKAIHEQEKSVEPGLKQASDVKENEILEHQKLLEIRRMSSIKSAIAFLEVKGADITVDRMIQIAKRIEEYLSTGD